MGGRLKIGTAIFPRRKEGAVPLQHNTVIDQTEPEEQVRQTGRLLPSLSEHRYLQPRFGVLPNAATPLLAG